MESAIDVLSVLKSIDPRLQEAPRTQSIQRSSSNSKSCVSKCCAKKCCARILKSANFASAASEIGYNNTYGNDDQFAGCPCSLPRPCSCKWQMIRCGCLSCGACCHISTKVPECYFMEWDPGCMCCRAGCDGLPLFCCAKKDGTDDGIARTMQVKKVAQSSPGTDPDRLTKRAAALHLDRPTHNQFDANETRTHTNELQVDDQKANDQPDGTAKLPQVSSLLRIKTMTKPWVKRSRMAVQLSKLSRIDSPPDSDDFYTIANPFPKDKTAPGWRESVIRKIRSLTQENEAILDCFFRTLHTDDDRFSVVDSEIAVRSRGQIFLKHNRKSVESIFAKANRPSIKAEHPKFEVHHVRDTFRFKAVVDSFGDALMFLERLNDCMLPGKKALEHVVKLDLKKLTKPKAFGWRFLAFDFCMPNGQLVECYVVFAALERAKKFPPSNAERCADLSCHEIFAKWRGKDLDNLSPQMAAEYQADSCESRRRCVSDRVSRLLIVCISASSQV